MAVEKQEAGQAGIGKQEGADAKTRQPGQTTTPTSLEKEGKTVLNGAVVNDNENSSNTVESNETDIMPPTNTQQPHVGSGPGKKPHPNAPFMVAAAEESLHNAKQDLRNAEAAYDRALQYRDHSYEVAGLEPPDEDDIVSAVNIATPRPGSPFIDSARPLDPTNNDASIGGPKGTTPPQKGVTEKDSDATAAGV